MQISGVTEGPKCSICFEVFGLDDQIFEHSHSSGKEGGGKHSYHLDCLGGWLKNYKNCPVCSEDISPLTNSFVPLYLRIPRDAYTFCKGRPVEVIFGVGLPLIGLEIALLSGAETTAVRAAALIGGAVFTIGAVVVAGFKVPERFETALAVSTGVTAVAVGAIGAVGVGIAAGAKEIALRAVGAVGVVGGSTIGGVMGAAVELAAEPRNRQLVRVATAGMIALSTLVHGGGWAGAATTFAISAATSYFFSNKMR